MTKYIFKLLFVTLFLCIINSCQKNDELEQIEAISTNQHTANDSDASMTRSASSTQQLILGKKLENPFSVSNMKKAVQMLKDADDDVLLEAGVPRDVLGEIRITPTDLYVRFLPQDSLSHANLVNDENLTLFEFPLDYEIEQYGDYYEATPVENSDYIWLYTTVKPNYTAPNGVKYEVLSELFLPENSEYYTEEVISTDIPISEAIYEKKLLDPNVTKTLVVASFDITGNQKELAYNSSQESPETRVTVTETVHHKFLWKRWTTTRTVYYPDGHIRVNTPNGNLGVKGVKVRMWRWFYYSDARTNSSGYYMSKAKWNSLWIGNNINYFIHFDGENQANRWTIDRSIVGALCLWTDKYNAGSHHPNGHSMTFYTSSNYWGKCVLNNAIYDYVNYAKNDKISLPPSNIQIANKESDDLTSSAPLLRNHFNVSLVYADPSWGSIGTIYGYDLFGWAMPDLILRYTSNINDYNEITSIVWHELTHASHLQSMKSEKGYSWASLYWSKNVLQQAKNSLATDNPYGVKGGDNWQIIALSEGWGKYRQWQLSIDKLGYNCMPTYNGGNNHYTFDDYKNTNNAFNIYYAGMFQKLRGIGCSLTNMEKALSSDSIVQFKQKIINFHPSLENSIEQIMEDYE